MKVIPFWFLAILLTATPSIQAQQPTRVPRIGYLSAATVADNEGGLMSYGASLTDLDRRAAVYVDKILRGSKLADLPVEQPTKFEFVINLRTAKQIGLTVPPEVLARANRIIR
jgi:putative ABC transport system substrate-binding protein